eukprot:1194018-Prorocentrum_minimum.AAC.5
MPTLSCHSSSADVAAVELSRSLCQDSGTLNNPPRLTIRQPYAASLPVAVVAEPSSARCQCGTNILPPLLRLVFTLSIYFLPSCDWFSHWVHTASPLAIGSNHPPTQSRNSLIACLAPTLHPSPKSGKLREPITSERGEFTRQWYSGQGTVLKAVPLYGCAASHLVALPQYPVIIYIRNIPSCRTPLSPLLPWPAHALAPFPPRRGHEK